MCAWLSPGQRYYSMHPFAAAASQEDDQFPPGSTVNVPRQRTRPAWASVPEVDLISHFMCTYHFFWGTVTSKSENKQRVVDGIEGDGQDQAVLLGLPSIFDTQTDRHKHTCEELHVVLLQDLHYTWCFILKHATELSFGDGPSNQYANLQAVLSTLAADWPGQKRSSGGPRSPPTLPLRLAICDHVCMYVCMHACLCYVLAAGVICLPRRFNGGGEA